MQGSANLSLTSQIVNILTFECITVFVKLRKSAFVAWKKLIHKEEGGEGDKYQCDREIFIDWLLPYVPQPGSDP